MASIRRIISARANGARSKGPKTPAGKSRSSFNAMRHGLLAKTVVLENESTQAFEALYSELVNRFGPADGIELGFLEEMATSFWRMRRAWAIEASLLDQRLSEQSGPDEVARIAGAFSQLASSPELSLLHRYETRLHCAYQRAFHNLLLLRTAEIPNEPNPISEHPEENPEPERALLPPGDQQKPEGPGPSTV
ncbi:MAG TPA: hypothetical protein VN577_12495 [Terriglobales bacterium]|nr:hypothetical protein [Terriglobales bacterium]